MTFKEYYLKLKTEERPPHPARQFILTIAAATGRSHKTVQQWISGIQMPGQDSMSRISDLTGIPLEELFPSDAEVM